jgi:hypothetical protein
MTNQVRRIQVTGHQQHAEHDAEQRHPRACESSWNGTKRIWACDFFCIQTILLQTLFVVRRANSLFRTSTRVNVFADSEIEEFA